MINPGIATLWLLVVSALPSMAAEPLQAKPDIEHAFTDPAPAAESAELDKNDVPEPGSFALVGIGGMLIILRRRRGRLK